MATNDLQLQQSNNINNGTRRKRQRQHQQRQRREILTEEEYTSTLSSIIQRDYFPESNSLLYQNALLDRRLAGDVAGAVQVRRAARQLIDEEESNRLRRQYDDEHDLLSVKDSGSGTTNAIIVRNNGPALGTQPVTHIRKRPRSLQDETVTGFHARVTSEDDYEFETNQQHEIQTNRERLQNVFHGDNGVRRRRSQPVMPITNGKNADDDDGALASDDFTAESNQKLSLEWKQPSTKNLFFFNPAEEQDADLAEGTNEGNNDQMKLLTAESTTSTNTVPNPMLPPSQHQTQNMLVRRQRNQQQQQQGTNGRDGTTTLKETTTEISNKAQRIEYIPKSVVEEKLINPSQTRFPSIHSHGNKYSSIIPRLEDHTLSTVGSRGGAIVNLQSMSLVRRQNNHNNKKTDMSDTDDSMSVTDASQYSTDLDEPLRSVEVERRNRKRYEQRHGNGGGSAAAAAAVASGDLRYPFVPMSPRVPPGLSGRESPTTTLETLDATPGHVMSGQQLEQQLQSSTSSASTGRTSQFAVAAESQRERAARTAELELARRAKKAKQSSSSSSSRRKDKNRPSSSSSSLRSTSRQAKSLTPAAMALLGRTGSKLVTSQRDKFSSSLRRSYTPKREPSSSSASVASSRSGSIMSSSRRSSRGNNGSSRRDHAFNSTPLIGGSKFGT